MKLGRGAKARGGRYHDGPLDEMQWQGKPIRGRFEFDRQPISSSFLLLDLANHMHRNRPANRVPEVPPRFHPGVAFGHVCMKGRVFARRTTQKKMAWRYATERRTGGNPIIESISTRSSSPPSSRKMFRSIPHSLQSGTTRSNPERS